MAQDITLTLSVVQAYYNQLQSALSGMESELVDFLSEPRTNNVCIQDKHHNTGLVVCVRKVDRIVDQRPMQTCLDICTVAVNAPFNRMGAVANIVKIMQKRNPFALTYLHQVTNSGLNGYLSKAGWVHDKGFNFYRLTRPVGTPAAA